MRSHELARQLFKLPDGEVIIQSENSERCRGCGDPLTASQESGPDIILLSPYGPAGHLEIAGSPDNHEMRFVQDVECV